MIGVRVHNYKDTLKTHLSKELLSMNESLLKGGVYNICIFDIGEYVKIFKKTQYFLEVYARWNYYTYKVLIETIFLLVTVPSSNWSFWRESLRLNLLEDAFLNDNDREHLLDTYDNDILKKVYDKIEDDLLNIFGTTRCILIKWVNESSELQYIVLQSDEITTW